MQYQQALQIVLLAEACDCIIGVVTVHTNNIFYSICGVNRFLYPNLAQEIGIDAWVLMF